MFFLVLLICGCLATQDAVPQSGVIMLNNTVGNTTLFKAVFINPEQDVPFLRLYTVNACMNRKILPCVGPILVSRLNSWSNIRMCLYWQQCFSKKNTYIAASCAYWTLTRPLTDLCANLILFSSNGKDFICHEITRMTRNWLICKIQCYKIGGTFFFNKDNKAKKQANVYKKLNLGYFRMRMRFKSTSQLHRNH